MENKMTYVVALNNVINGNVDAETIEKIKALKVSLEKKASNKKETKTQLENKALKDTILEVMSNGVSGTCTEISKADDRLRNLSVPKMSALLKQLVADEKVVKTVEGKKSIFSIA